MVIPVPRFTALLMLLVFPMSAFADDKKSPVGLEGVQADGFAIISVNVAQLWGAEALKPLRDALLKTEQPMMESLEKASGLKIGEIERITLYWPAVTGKERSMEPFVFFVARKPLDRAKVIKTLSAKTAEELAKGPNGQAWEGLSGKNIVFRDGGAVIFVDDRTSIATPEIRDDVPRIGAFMKVLDGTTPRVTAGSLAEALAAVGEHAVVAGIDLGPLRKNLEGGKDFPDEAKPFLTMAKAERGFVSFDVGSALKASGKLTFSDADTAKKAEPDAKKIVEFAIAEIGKLRKAKDRDAETDAIVLPLLDFAKAAFEKPDLKLDGKALSATLSGEIDTTLKTVMTAFPAWAAAQSERMKTANNLKQIGLAMHGYHDAVGHFPQDITDKDGKAILSWRVELLPYLEQDNLYKKIDRTKPWDDGANKGILEMMPDVLKVYGRDAKEKGFTYFQCFTSPKELQTAAPFLVPGSKRKLTEITDGTAHTLMVVDGEAAVNWLKPGDLPYDPQKLPKFGNPKTAKLAALFCDGSVGWLNLKKLDDKTLHGLITINGGEVLDYEK
jgi:hypothetical protein